MIAERNKTLPSGARPLRADVSTMPVKRLVAIDLLAGDDVYETSIGGGGADDSSSEAERVYVVLEGQITVTTEDGPVVLGPLDSCLIPPGETRSVQNATNRPASMLVIVVP